MRKTTKRRPESRRRREQLKLRRRPKHTRREMKTWPTPRKLKRMLRQPLRTSRRRWKPRRQR